jgi:hypothetical protein
MSLTLLAIACGLLVGWGCGGTVGVVRDIPLVSWPLLALGLAARAAPEVAEVPTPVAWNALAALALAGFCLRNLKLIGLGVIGVGITLNLSVTLANGGMPVEPDALATAGITAGAVSPSELELAGGRHVASADDRIRWLGDRIPVPAFGVVVSFGDLVVLVGLADLTANLLLARRQRLVVSGPAPPREPRRHDRNPPTDPDRDAAPTDADRELMTIG